MPYTIKAPNFERAIVTPVLNSREKAVNGTVRRTAQAIGRRLRDDVGLSSRYAIAKNTTGPGGTTRVRYSRGLDSNVWVGLNPVPVDAIRGDVSHGARPKQVVSKREGAVPRSFFFSPNANRANSNTSLSRNLAFRRTGSGRNQITRITTPIEAEGQSIIDNEASDSKIQDRFSEELRKDF